MAEIILKVENISKQYRLGLVGTGTLSHDLNRWWHFMRGKEDPYLKVGAQSDRSKKTKSEYVWALKNINFKVQQGEVLGIIGKNGAGKSTLLKILSRVTSPTTGQIKSKGRIASLLEVGTGFHPELTGLENIYLNGAILGMTKAEIKQKEEEIIDFSGCAQYIDTPVKRYSSGMRVRLAFAVAAFLDPDILVVDEVLAVGDAEFQKKAIGKMQDISRGEGRTVLFVSHNMDSILKLTQRTIVLENGEIVFEGIPEKAVQEYLQIKDVIKSYNKWNLEDAPGNDFAKLNEIGVYNCKMKPHHNFNIIEDITISITYWDFNKENKNTAIIQLFDQYDTLLFASNEFNAESWDEVHDKDNKLVNATCTIPGNFLAEGKYKVLVAVGNYNPNMVHVLLEEALTFAVLDNTMNNEGVRRHVGGRWPGLIRPYLNWTIKSEPI